MGYDKGTDEKEDERTIILAKANMLIYFSELLSKYNSAEHLRAFAGDAFNKVFHLLRSNLGTFAEVRDEPYDLILTNPPYVTSGSSSLRRAITEEGLSGYYTAGGRGTEALAIEWVIRNLKPGGTAMLIVPDGLMNQPAILSYTKRECFVRGIISLPIRTFYSTPKKTYILILERKRRTEDEQTDPVFTYLVSEIGETRDAKRWELEENDLTGATALYNQFKGSPTYFSSPPGTMRCKVVSNGEFRKKPHWLIDRWWSQEERRDLGNVNEQSVVSDDELQEAVQGLKETLALVESSEASDVEQYAFREIGLNSVAFELYVGRRRLKKNMVDEGIPVYSANPTEVFGFIPVRDLGMEFDRPALLWGIDGTFDWGYVPEGQPFVATDHCGVLYVAGENILPRYLYHELRATKDSYGFDRTYRANLENMQASVKVRIPTKTDGSFDLDAQQQIVAKYDRIQTMQIQLIQQLEALSGMKYEWQYFTDELAQLEE